jgi:hypothetical protein
VPYKPSKILLDLSTLYLFPDCEKFLFELVYILKCVEDKDIASEPHPVKSISIRTENKQGLNLLLLTSTLNGGPCPTETYRLLFRLA